MAGDRVSQIIGMMPHRHTGHAGMSKKSV